MNANFKSRLISVFLFFLSLYLIAIINLYIIQIHKSSFYKNLADNQYKITITSTPERGEIFDRNGKILAANKEALSCFITPRNLEDKNKLIKFLNKNFPNAVKRLHEKENDFFMYIKRRLSPEEIKLIQESNISDLKFLKEPTRHYTQESLGPVIGITDIDNDGLFGIEKIYNTILSGTPTTYVLEKDARSGQYYFQKEVILQGSLGKNLTLTIDADLQYIAEQELANYMEQFESTEGAALIMDAVNGDILAMVNQPSFDINDTKELDLEKTKNKIITDVHEFGSVIKVFLALAAIDENVVQEDESIDCENSKSAYIDRIKINTWKANGILTFKEVIQKSNNIGVAKIAQRLQEKIYDHYKRVGFGQKTGIDFIGEQKGFVNSPNNWSRQSIFSLSYGYEITANILQLARAFALLFNGGYLVTPRLVLTDKKIEKSGPLYGPETLSVLKNILQKEPLQDYKLFGKTGTANLLINGLYDNNRNTYTYTGIIEKDNFKKVIVLFVKESNKKDIYAATVAEPIFRNIAHQMVVKNKLGK